MGVAEGSEVTGRRCMERAVQELEREREREGLYTVVKCKGEGREKKTLPEGEFTFK